MARGLRAKCPASAWDLPTEPWKFYDVGDGYCTYDFFDQCQHRMASAKCDFYMPKESTAALLLEDKTHLLRSLQEIPLGEAEHATVEDGVAAYERLRSRLADVPTPAGPTPVSDPRRPDPDHICPPALPASRIADSPSSIRQRRAGFTSAIITGTSTSGAVIGGEGPAGVDAEHRSGLRDHIFSC